MLRKFFILAFISTSSVVFSQNCRLLDTLIIPDSLTACWRDTLRLELRDSTLLDEVNASLSHRWWYAERTDTTKNSFFVFPSIGDISGVVWVEITNTLDDCKDTFSIVVTLPPPPTLIEPTEMIDTTLCLNDTLRLTMPEVEYADYFSWKMDVIELERDTVQEVIFDSVKTSINVHYYIITFRNNSCFLYNPYPPNLNVFSRNDTVARVFFARPPVVDLGLDTTACDDGSGYELIALSSTDFKTSEYKFRWNNDDNEKENTFQVFYENKGIQFVEVWNEVCQKRDSILYTVRDTVDIDFWSHQWTNAHRLTLDTFVFCGGTVTLNAEAKDLEGMATYHWSGGNVDTTSTDNPVRIVSQGSYTVILKDSAGCERTFTISITDKSDDAKVDMPNVFTPNGDGRNDDFTVMTHSNVKNFHLRIYNRWGRVVYEFDGSNPDEAKWDGNNTPEGVYFWVVKYKDGCGKSYQERGTVTLLR